MLSISAWGIQLCVIGRWLVGHGMPVNKRTERLDVRDEKDESKKTFSWNDERKKGWITWSIIDNKWLRVTMETKAAQEGSRDIAGTCEGIKKSAVVHRVQWWTEMKQS